MNDLIAELTDAKRPIGGIIQMESAIEMMPVHEIRTYLLRMGSSPEYLHVDRLVLDAFRGPQPENPRASESRMRRS